jgi:hypothetical protein
MPLDPDAAFARAQREYDAQTPPEGEEECRWHPWDEEANGPFDGEPCRECIAMAEDWADGAYDRMKDDG